MKKAIWLLMCVCFVFITAFAYAGGDAEETSSTTTTSKAVSDGKYAEAPEFTEMVKNGELPPVEDRLPENPMVVEVPEIGVYGGDLQYPTGSAYQVFIWTYEGLVRYPKGGNGSEVVADLAESYEVNDDYTKFTFHLRKGLKWSDGQPYTTADVMFWWEDWMNNKELQPNLPGWLKSGGEPAVVTAQDDYTITFEFANTNINFLNKLAFESHGSPSDVSKHYLSQFHPGYTSEEELNKLVEDGGFEDWTQLFISKRRQGSMVNPDLPTMAAWKLVQSWPETMIMERNPYYFKVDQAGNQLPYIDRVVSRKVESSMVSLTAADGQTDFQYTYLSFDDYTMLKLHEEEGGYRVLQWGMLSGPMSIHMNQHNPDPEKRELLRTKEFRYALSYAIDRKTVSDLLLSGLGIIEHMVDHPASPYYEEGMGQTAIEFDVKKANRLLDELGLDKRDTDGNRLLPSGKRLEFIINSFSGAAGTSDAYQMAAEMWTENIGIKTTVSLTSGDVWRETIYAGEAELIATGYNLMNWDNSGGQTVPVYPHVYWASQYGRWYQTKGESGEEPPDEIKQLTDWFEQMGMEIDSDKRIEVGRNILRAHDENVWVMHIARAPFSPVVVNARLRNVLEEGFRSWLLTHEAQTWQEQLFYVDGKRK